MILIDTTGLWGLIFEDSKYHSFMMDNLSGKTIYVLDVQIFELFRIVYRAFSKHGKDFKVGLNKLTEVAGFFEDRLYETKSIKIIYMETRHSDYLEAIRILRNYPEIFAREGPKHTLWPEIIDAIIATCWRKNRATLYTKDESLIRFGEKEKLDYVIIKT